METNNFTKIIIVDDDISTCETLSDIFSLKNFHPATAHNGENCLEIIKQQAIDVAILDIKLPDIDGLELLERIRETIPDLIAVFVTGHASINYAKKALEQGASGFFVKPLNIDEILHVIHEALKKRSLTRRYKETSAKLHNIISASCDAIFSIDSSGKIIQSNKAAEKIFGYSDEELIQMNVGLLLGKKHDIKKSDFSAHHYNLDKSNEVFGHNKNGNTLLLEISVGPYEENGEKMFSLIIRDVSARNKHEEEKKKFQEQLIQANKIEAIGTLAGGIAHDFNNILTAILGYSQIVFDTLEEGSSTQKDIGQVINAGFRAKELVRQILAFSRKSEQDAQPVQANLIVKEVLNLLRSSIPKSIEIVSKFKSSRTTILINPAQFHQVVMNLCVNAYQAMSENGILKIHVNTFPMSLALKNKFSQLKAKEYLELEVKDTGKGMDHLIIKRIFEPYFTTKKMEEGTGLGLSTTHGIILAAGGAIDVESKLGQGSTFTVYLPLVEENISTYESTADETIPSGKERILFIDDEIPIAELGKRILEKLGYQVSSFSCSETALNVLKKNPADFDLIITDNSMPKITGLQLAKEIYTIRPDLPIILSTGFADNINKKLLRNIGIKAIIAKPISRKKFPDTVRKILDGETLELNEEEHANRKKPETK